jgi:hypothetical protein
VGQDAQREAKAALENLKPGEPELGALSWGEQNWLGTAMAHLTHVYQKRALTKPDDYCFCIFSFSGHIFVQFSTVFDEESLYCEAVSAAFSNSARSLTEQRENLLLREFGFAPPGDSPNYSREIDVHDLTDLGYAARLAFRVLKQVYLVERFEVGTFKLRIPGER